MSDESFLKRLRVASPCPARWDQMQGDDRVRFCQLCQLEVFNVSELTTRELRGLSATNGRICGRIYRRADGTVITRDCPVGLKALHRRIVKTAGAVLGAILSISLPGYAQTNDKDKQDPDSQKQSYEIRREIAVDQQPGLTGVITDEQGAVIAGATVTLINSDNKPVSTAATNGEGQFTFTNLPSGLYTLEISSPPFQRFVLTELALDQQQLANVRLKLKMGALVGEIVFIPEIESPHLDLPQTIIPKPLKPIKPIKR